MPRPRPSKPDANQGQANGKSNPASGTPSSTSRGHAEIFLVLSGLNFRPGALNALAELVEASGAATAVGLPRGYFTGRGEEGCHRPEEWLEAAGDTLSDLTTHNPGARISLLGFSLGALVGLSWGLGLMGGAGFRWHRAVMVAPAFCPRGCESFLLKQLAPRLPGHWKLPGMTPAKYRMHRHTPVAAYRSVLQLAEAFRGRVLAMTPEELAARLPPQFIAYSPRDELISNRFLYTYQQQCLGNVTRDDVSGNSVTGDRVALHRLNHWSYPMGFHHLATGPDVLGSEEWRRLGSALHEWMAAEDKRTSGTS